MNEIRIKENRPINAKKIVQFVVENQKRNQYIEKIEKNTNKIPNGNAFKNDKRPLK